MGNQTKSIAIVILCILLFGSILLLSPSTFGAGITLADISLINYNSMIPPDNAQPLFEEAGTPAPATPVAEGITLSNLYINPDQAHPGEKVSISVLVTNSSNDNASFYLDLMVNGINEESNFVNISGHSARKVIFTTSQNEPGTYKISIGDLEGSFFVTRENNSAPRPLNWWLMGVLVAACLILIWVIIRALTAPRQSG